MRTKGVNEEAFFWCNYRKTPKKKRHSEGFGYSYFSYWRNCWYSAADNRKMVYWESKTTTGGTPQQETLTVLFCSFPYHRWTSNAKWAMQKKKKLLLLLFFVLSSSFFFPGSQKSIFFGRIAAVRSEANMFKSECPTFWLAHHYMITNVDQCWNAKKV